MNETHNNSHMKQRRKTNANSHTAWIPQIIATSLINPCQTVQCSAEMFFHTIPLLLRLGLLYKLFTITLNRLKCGNIDPQEKGVVLTAEELKYNHRKKFNNLPLKIRDIIAFDHLEILLLDCMKENR